MDALAADPAAALRGAADKDGVFLAGLKSGAVDFTDFVLYSRYKPDGADIKAVVEHDKALMQTGELSATY
jgi:hypothetical protein